MVKSIRIKKIYIYLPQAAANTTGQALEGGLSNKYNKINNKHIGIIINGGKKNIYNKYNYCVEKWR